MNRASSRHRLLPLVVLSALSLIAPECAQRDQLLVFIELDVMENRQDGCTNCGCRARGELRIGEKREWWLALRLLDPSPADESSERRASGARSHCGTGAFSLVSPELEETVGRSYVITELETTLAAGPGGRPVLEVRSRTRKRARLGPASGDSPTEVQLERSMGAPKQTASALRMVIEEARATGDVSAFAEAAIGLSRYTRS